MIARATNPARYPLPVRCVPAFAAEITCIAIDAAATSAAGATEHSCGAAGTVFQAARGVSCTAARRLACRHSVMNGRCHVCALAKPSCRLDGCTCRRTLLAGGDTRVRCTTGAKRVRFF
jgi:hypothetical protein